MEIRSIDVMAWPLVAVLFIFCFRKPLSTLVEQIGKIRYKGVEDEDGPYANFPSFYDDQMESLANATAGSKFGVENSGRCLLIAWTNELIQQGAGWYPR